MGELPEKYPEYSIMYKTLSKQIKSLQQGIKKGQGKDKEEVQLKIQKYKLEMSKIKKMFPDGFFDKD